MSTETSVQANKLAHFRQQIDSIDSKIMELLLQRVGVVKQVGEYKREHELSPCPIRAGREAEMLRSIIQKFGKTDFPAGAAAAIWRIIIGASTGLEADMTLSVFASEKLGEKNNDLYWLAREYFGAHSEIIKQPQVKRVVGDVVDSKAAVGIVPFSRNQDDGQWWTALLQQGENTPKIFAHIPFVYSDTQSKYIPAALAFAKLSPEPSGDDRTLLVIEAEVNVSHSRLQMALQAAKLEATWIDIATITPDTRHHFLEIKGFITKENSEIIALTNALGASLYNTYFLGAYAVPVTIYSNEK
jgi:chorismate mutase